MNIDLNHVSTGRSILTRQSIWLKAAPSKEKLKGKELSTRRGLLFTICALCIIVERLEFWTINCTLLASKLTSGRKRGKRKGRRKLRKCRKINNCKFIFLLFLILSKRFLCNGDTVIRGWTLRRILCGILSFRKVIMAEEKEREVKNAAKDLVKTQRRAARWEFDSLSILCIICWVGRLTKAVLSTALALWLFGKKMLTRRATIVSAAQLHPSAMPIN